MPNRDVWRQIDQVLLNTKLAAIAEEMHPKLAVDKAAAHSEGFKKGNTAFYPAERVRFEERRADEWAEKEYQAASQVWETQGYKPSRAFYRAVYENLLAPLFATRKAAVIADMGLEDQRTGRIGHSAGAQGAFARSMGKPSSRWNRNNRRPATLSGYLSQRFRKPIPLIAKTVNTRQKVKLR